MSFSTTTSSIIDLCNDDEEITTPVSSSSSSSPSPSSPLPRAQKISRSSKAIKKSKGKGKEKNKDKDKSKGKSTSKVVKLTKSVEYVPFSVPVPERAEEERGDFTIYRTNGEVEEFKNVVLDQKCCDLIVKNLNLVRFDFLSFGRRDEKPTLFNEVPPEEEYYSGNPCTIVCCENTEDFFINCYDKFMSECM
jgi:hypothetical protein